MLTDDNVLASLLVMKWFLTVFNVNVLIDRSFYANAIFTLTGYFTLYRTQITSACDGVISKSVSRSFIICFDGVCIS